jgi:hypothetical protein
MENFRHGHRCRLVFNPLGDEKIFLAASTV